MRKTIAVKTLGPANWIQFIEENRELALNTSPDEVLIDFSGARFLQPMHVVSLACLIEIYALKGAKIFIRQGTYNINRYLLNIRLGEYWNEGFDRNAFTPLKIDTTFCLWKVKNSMIDSYATQAQRYFQNSYFEGKDLQSLHISLTEVFNNIFDHSASPVDGYVITQCFPNIGQIVTSICDMGVGIPTKINQIWEAGGKGRLNDEDALRAAFIRKISSKSQPHNRGFGLANLFEIIKRLNGQLMVLSNNAVFQRLSNGITTTYPSNISFNGTLIVITLDKRYLPDVEHEVDGEEFIF